VAAEGVHLTALAENAQRSSASLLPEARSVLLRHPAVARLGAVLADLPYFEDTPSALARAALGMPRRASAWGDRLHAGGEERLLAAILVRVHDGRASFARGGPGRDAVLALALGLASHLAVDEVTHPVSDRLARARAAARHTSERDEHHLVEGVQSLLFHAESADPRLADPRQVAAAQVEADGRFVRLLAGAIGEATGVTPPDALLARWLRGYRRAALVAGSPLGRLVGPSREHRELRSVLYRGPGIDFERVFADAERASREAVERAFVAAHDGR